MRFVLFTTAVSLLEFANQVNAVAITPTTQKPSVTEGVDIFATSELAQSDKDEKAKKAPEEASPIVSTKLQDDYFKATVDKIIKRSNEEGAKQKQAEADQKKAESVQKQADSQQQGADSKGSPQSSGNDSGRQGQKR